jgi:cystathionine beta-lyase
MMNIIDLEALVELKKGKDILLAVDNTFATPYLQNPIDIGADLVMHSVTKYLGGHSDVVMGALVIDDKAISEEIYRIQNSSGAIPGPMDCFLVLRGLKTLHLRMQRHCENGKQVADFLAQHPRVKNVYWPGLENHPGYKIAKQQMRGFGGMISFSLKSGGIESAKQVLQQFKLFSLAESLGGVESLVCHPATMTHGSVPEKDRQDNGIVDSLIRLSVGVEDIDDLIEDLKQALAQK